MITTTTLKAGAAALLLAAATSWGPALADDGYGRPPLLRFALFGQYQWTTVGESSALVATGAATNSSTGVNGFGWGAGVGLDWVRGRLLYGVEGDFTVLTGVSLNNSNVLYDQKYLGTLRGRLGWYMRPDWLLYGTLGIAAMSLGSETKSPVAAGEPANLHTTRTGPVIGIGTEIDLHDYAKLFAEYMHAGFGDWRHQRTLTDYNAGISANIVRFGVRFAFGPEHFRSAGW